MKRELVLAGLLLAGGCSKPPAEPVAPMNELQRFAAKMEAEDRASDDANPCVRLETEPIFKVPILHMIRPRDCKELMPSEVMRGVWFTGFEESAFIPNVDTVELHRVMSRDDRNVEFDTYLDIDDEEALSRLGLEPRPRGTLAISITFVGRRAKPYRNRDGSQGMAIVVVDAILNGRLLGEATFAINCRDFPPRGYSGVPCAPGTEGPGGPG